MPLLYYSVTLLLPEADGTLDGESTSKLAEKLPYRVYPCRCVSVEPTSGGEYRLRIRRDIVNSQSSVRYR